ncbi:cytochrome P450 [Coniophora puteana RWD-64-598 SS2]|uniref:Cytochrome P450 n=1 Tax=Coniophora puteana (strain RWD-64-598) TaxID=741705 RepID=A0A5M3MZ85_CONPW|nr:cytochrome P450 [Coniophora puteana RWD-64-598 SS2]EIW84460.1 cytochrome P450 [Coniophora puteana RWD-64-598 SS2]
MALRDPATWSSLTLGVGAALVVVRWALRDRRQRDEAYPPGPSPIPILGNLHQLDTTQPWLTYTAWKEQYGDVVYFRQLGQDVVVLNTEEAAEDVLDNRSANYSDRMDLSIIFNSYGMKFFMILERYGDVWRAYRRLFQQCLRQDIAKTFRPAQSQRAHELVENLATTPEQFYDHIRRYSASVVLKVVYDHDLRGGEDDVFNTVLEGVDMMNKTVTPANILLVSVFPFLQYIPAWLPGIGWRNGARCRKFLTDMINAPFDALEKHISSGYANGCFGADALEKFRDTDKIQDFETLVRNACGALYSAGEETTGSILTVFMLAMTLFPEAQRRAQEEIDRVVGPDRLPDYEDRASLTYLEAVYRETLRWKPTGAQGIAHAAVNEDIYKGYYIPKGCVVIPNVWGMSQNPDKYSNPSTFMPERFFRPDGTLNDDKIDYVFGFGRRVCPGRHVATNSLWMAMASILASLKIEKVKDSSGNIVEFEPEWFCATTM